MSSHQAVSSTYPIPFLTSHPAPRVICQETIQHAHKLEHSLPLRNGRRRNWENREDNRLPQIVHPAERTGTIEDMAGAVLYLTLRAEAYLDGNVIVTDGGRLSVLPSSY